MDATAMFSLTYGLFIDACVINTAVQATAEPVKMHVTMMKTNLTTQLIRRKGSLAVSVLSLDCPLATVAAFGMRSGRNADKFAGVEHKTDVNGNPYLGGPATIAVMSLEVASMLDLGTHLLFICDVPDAKKTGAGRPMTYGDYRALKSGAAPRAEKQQPQKI